MNTHIYVMIKITNIPEKCSWKVSWFFFFKVAKLNMLINWLWRPLWRQQPRSDKISTQHAAQARLTLRPPSFDNRCVFRITSKGTSTSLTASSPTPPGPTSRSWTDSTCRWRPARRWPSWAAAAAGRAPACSCWRGSTTPITAEWWGSQRQLQLLTAVGWSDSTEPFITSLFFTPRAQLITRKLYTAKLLYASRQTCICFDINYKDGKDKKLMWRITLRIRLDFIVARMKICPGLKVPVSHSTLKQ